MMSVFEYLEYRPCLSAKAKEIKSQRPGWTLQRLAEKAAIRAPYLTNVFKERAHFSADQLFALSEVYGFNEEETEYCLLLLEHERSGHLRRRQKLKEDIEKVRRDKLRSEAHIRTAAVEVDTESYARYYTNPELKLINFFLAIPRFSENPHRIAACLNISAEHLEKLLKELIELGFVKKTKNGVESLQREFHLKKDSPLCQPHQLLMHYRSLQHQQLLDDDKKYNFSVTFTADEKTREKIHREFLGFLSQIEEYVKEAPEEEVYQLHFDLFPWSK